MSPSRPAGYLICATPRSGSTLLCGLLRATGVAGRPESYFRAPDLQAWADRWRLPRVGGGFDDRDYLQAAVAAGSTGNGVFAARVMWGTVEELVRRVRGTVPGRPGSDADLLAGALGPLRYVHLWREDTVAQAVSWVRAEQTGYWQHGDTRRPGREPRFDMGQIDGTVRMIDAHNRAWRDWFAAQGIRPHPVRHEDLVDDMAGVTAGILRVLGLEVPAGQQVVAAHQRQADEVNRDWIARYRSITAAAAAGGT